LVEVPFWGRYPSLYLEKDGVATFSEVAYITEQHERWLTEDYFPLVGSIRRNPRYINKRIVDPQIKCFVDEDLVEVPTNWGLPTPNAEASYKSLAKYAKDIMPLSEKQVSAMNEAWSWTERHFGVYMADSVVLDYESAKTHLDLSTSSGAPFNIFYPTKKELFEKDENIDEWLQSDWYQMSEDPKWTCLFTNSLKEEMRLDEKMKENSIRTFLSGGVDAVMHGTRLFVDMNEKMYASHLKSASAVGMSPYYGNWNKLYEKLNVFRKGYALDESQYDSSLRNFLMWGCAKLRFQMLRPEDRNLANMRRIQVYYRNLVNTLVICPDGVIVMKKGGNPSGSVNTITDNTLILYTLLAYAWILLAPPDFKTYSTFEAHTSKVLVGDDNTWTVSDDAHVFYNAISVIDCWKEIGVTTTTDSFEPRRAADLDFLSAKTIFMNGVAVPLYERAKLMNSLLYAPKAHLTPETTLERTAAMLSVGWTDLPFRKFCREVIAWLIDKYDEVLKDSPRWILAKCQIQTDERLNYLFTGDRYRFYLPAQSMSGKRVKIIKPDKSRIMSSVPKVKNNMKRKRVRTRKAKPNKRGITRMRPANVGSTVVTINKPPIQRMLANGNVLVKHKEFISKIAGSVNFSINTVPINPGLPAQFAWLYNIANNYESYRFRKLDYVFINSKTGTFAGDVIMGIDYDASDPVPFNESELQSYWGCKTGVLTRPLFYKADMLALNKVPNKFVRIGDLSANQDIKLYDSGNFFLATTDCVDTSNIGRLFVEYEVELKTPQTNGSNQLAGIVNPTGETNAAPLGTSFTNYGTLSPVWVSGTTFTVPVPGQYLLTLVQTGTTITVGPQVTAAAPSLATIMATGLTSTTGGVTVYAIKVASASDLFTIVVTSATTTKFNMAIGPFIYSIAPNILT
jgi:hypothetical protein